MAEGIYERLADALDALPNRYPRTASGVEIQILKKVFTPEEAALAGQMSRASETVADIANRVGLPEDKVKEMLGKMLPRGLVRRAESDGVARFRLGPFIVGWYERHLMMAPTDKEFCELFEKYLVEGGAAGILGTQPGVMRVVPVRRSLKPDLVQPYDDIDAHFERYERFGVINCVCRVEQNLEGSDCPMPVKRCSFAGLPPEIPLSQGDTDFRHVLDREQALKLYGELEGKGHVHLGGYGPVYGGG